MSHFCEDIPKILVGCKCDLRDDPSAINALKKYNQAPVTFEQGLDVAFRISAFRYIETSAKEKIGLDELFEHATRASILKPRPSKEPKKSRKKTSSDKKKKDCSVM